MPRLLLNLRDVPDDEAEEVLHLMQERGLVVYRTPAGPFGITAGGIWLRSDQDYPAARALLDDYQAERFETARAEHEQARKEGRAETWWSLIRRNPIRSLIHLAIAIFILFVLFAPMVQLGRIG
jgi:hypothetical protein